MNCIVEKCSRNVSCKQMCSLHYHRFKKTGITGIKRCREKHGMSYSDEYKIWDKMISRCSAKKGHQFKYYASRGIAVCPEWKESFSQFFKDMGKRPRNAQIDRIDNDKGYSPENCRWATIQENCQNTQQTKLTKTSVIEIYNSKEMNRVLADKYNVTTRTISSIKAKQSWSNITCPIEKEIAE